MSEPEGFKSEESVKNWLETKRKEFNWLLSQCQNAKSDVAKKRAEEKLSNWLDKHPKIQDKVIQEVADMLKGKTIDEVTEPGSDDWYMLKIKEIDDLFKSIEIATIVIQDSENLVDAWQHGVKGWMAKQASKIAVLQSIIEEKDKQIEELIKTCDGANEQNVKALKLIKDLQEDVDDAHKIIEGWHKTADEIVKDEKKLKKKVIKRLKK